MKGLLRVALLGYGLKKEMGPSRSEAHRVDGRSSIVGKSLAELNLRVGNNFHDSGIACLFFLL